MIDNVCFLKFKNSPLWNSALFRRIFHVAKSITEKPDFEYNTRTFGDLFSILGRNTWCKFVFTVYFRTPAFFVSNIPSPTSRSYLYPTWFKSTEYFLKRKLNGNEIDPSYGSWTAIHQFLKSKVLTSPNWSILKWLKNYFNFT